MVLQNVWSLLPISHSRRIPHSWAAKVMLLMLLTRLWSEVEGWPFFGLFPGERSGCSVTESNWYVIAIFVCFIKYNLDNWLSRAILKIMWRSWYETAFAEEPCAVLLSWYLLFAFLRLASVMMSLRHSKYFTNFMGESS